MVACVSTASDQFEETLNTLKYADRAKHISTTLAKPRRDPDPGRRRRPAVAERHARERGRVSAPPRVPAVQRAAASRHVKRMNQGRVHGEGRCPAVVDVALQRDRAGGQDGPVAPRHLASHLHRPSTTAICRPRPVHVHAPAPAHAPTALGRAGDPRGPGLERPVKQPPHPPRRGGPALLRRVSSSAGSSRRRLSISSPEIGRSSQRPECVQLSSGTSVPNLLQWGEKGPPHAEGFLSAAAFMSAVGAAQPSTQPARDPATARPLARPAHRLVASDESGPPHVGGAHSAGRAALDPQAEATHRRAEAALRDRRLPKLQPLASARRDGQQSEAGRAPPRSTRGGPAAAAAAAAAAARAGPPRAALRGAAGPSQRLPRPKHLPPPPPSSTLMRGHAAGSGLEGVRGRRLEESPYAARLRVPASARPGGEVPAARTKLRLLKQPTTYATQQVALAKRVAERPPASPSPVSVMEIGAEAASTQQW